MILEQILFSLKNVFNDFQLQSKSTFINIIFCASLNVLEFHDIRGLGHFTTAKVLVNFLPGTVMVFGLLAIRFLADLTRAFSAQQTLSPPYVYMVNY